MLECERFWPASEDERRVVTKALSREEQAGIEELALWVRTKGG
jgi:hypothetical protein